MGESFQSKKEIKRENNNYAPSIKKTLFFKRRSGPSSRSPTNKKQPNTNISNENWTDISSSSESNDNGNNSSTASLKNVIEESKQTSKDVNTEVNRNELFDKASKSKPKTKDKNKKERKRTKAASTKGASAVPVPLSLSDTTELNEINTIDKMVDEEIDLLGNQVNDLLQLSKVIGTKTNTQTTTLNKINNNLEDTNTRTKQVNKRLKLFTTSRRERNKKEKEFKERMNELLPATPGY